MPKLDYLYLRAWCWMMGSSRDYTEDQIERARKENAPEDAIYERHGPGGMRTGEWARASEISRDDTRELIDDYVANMTKEKHNG